MKLAAALAIQDLVEFAASLDDGDEDDGPGDLGDPFDAFEIHWVGEYTSWAGDETYCEPIDGQPGDDPNEPERITLMVTLYGHFERGGVHTIADSIVTDENPRREARSYIRKLAESVAAGRPIHDYT